MWNLRYSNKTCYTKDKLKEHKYHVNKIISAKSHVDTSCPFVPFFLINKCNTTQSKIYNKLKVKYENKNLLEKIRAIETNPSKYNPINLKVKNCPSFNKTSFYFNNKISNIDKENMKMYHRLKSAKPTYSSDIIEKNYKYNKYLEQLHRGNLINPCMYFDTAEKYKKALLPTIKHNKQDLKLRPLTVINTKRTTYKLDPNKCNVPNSNFNNWIKGGLGLCENKKEFIPQSAKN